MPDALSRDEVDALLKLVESLDGQEDLEYYRHGGILQKVLREMIKAGSSV